MHLSDLAAALESERTRQKMTQVELARRSGLSRLAVSQALSGRDLRVSTLLALAGSLGLALALVPVEAAQGLSGAAAASPADGPPMTLAESVRRRAAEARERIGGSGS